MKKTTHYKGHRWTNDEIVSLMQMWSAKEPLLIICENLNVTQTAVLKQIQRLRKSGVPLERRINGNKQGNAVRAWTQGEMEYLIRRRNEKANSEEIGAELNRTPNAVDAMIQKLRKENVYIAMRGNGVRRLWDAEYLRGLSLTPSLIHEAV